MSKPYIDATGYHCPDYPAVLDDVKADLRGIWGEDLYLDPDSQEGQLTAVLALARHDTYTLAGSVYNSYSPATAQGVGLSRMVKVNAIRRKVASRSTVDLCIIGQSGTLIRGGMAGDVANNRWILPAEVAVPLSGEVMVTAIAENAGDIRALAGDINRILTPTRGWQSVNNPLPAVPGAPVEIDADLRQRQTASTALPSLTVFDGTIGACASIHGVTRLRGYENDTGQTDEHGIPPHSICLVVEGGNTEAIAQAIAAKKSPGTGTYGDSAVLVQDKHGVPSVIKFFRPRPVALRVRVSLRPLDGYLSTTGQAIREAVASYLNGLGIGEDVLISRLYTPVNAADPQPARRTFDVLEIGLAAGDEPEPGWRPFAPHNLPLAFNAVAECEVEAVEVLTYA